MNKKRIKNLLLISLISIFLLIFNLIVKKRIFIFAESIMAAFMLVVVFLSVVFFGFQKDRNNRVKSDLLLQVGQILSSYFIVIYLLGIYFGYSKIVFSLKPASILNNIFAPIITFVCLEVFRYIIINNNRDKIRNIYFGGILISCDGERFVVISNSSSTASGLPSPTGEGFTCCRILTFPSGGRWRESEV